MDFQNFIDALLLEKVGFTGPGYTWCNNRQGRARVWKRLNRVLINQQWMGLKLSCSVAHLGRLGSDHAPLLISFRLEMNQGPRHFSFVNAWTSHHDFLGIVCDAWVGHTEGQSMRRLLQKLSRVKEGLCEWNKTFFGNVFDQVREVEADVTAKELVMELDDSLSNRTVLEEAQASVLICGRLLSGGKNLV